MVAYEECSEIVDEIMEWMALRWTKSMIKRELKKWFKDISPIASSILISRAKKKIMQKYGIDPQEYKGLQITFYEAVIRGGTKVRNKLVAAERLDKLFGLEQIQGEDPALLAEKIIAFKKAARERIMGKDNDDTSDDERQGKTDKKKSSDESNNTTQENKTTDENTNVSTENSNGIEDEDVIFPLDEITPEMEEHLKTIKEEELDSFRKRELE